MTCWRCFSDALRMCYQCFGDVLAITASFSIFDSPSEGTRGNTSEPPAATSAARVLLRALADVGLVCPIPAFADHQRSSLICSWVLVPDFAHRLRLTSIAATRVAGASAGGAV